VKTYLSSFISLFQLRPFRNYKTCKQLSKEYKSKAMRRIVGSISGAPTGTPQNSSTTSPSKTSDLHHHFFGFGNQDAATNLEPSHGYCSWTD